MTCGHGCNEAQVNMNCPLHNEEAFAKSPVSLTCSEVVERLLQEVEVRNRTMQWVDRAKVEAILHSWRERRVQELEEALRACMGVVWSEFHVGDGVCGEAAEPYAMGERALANSEQIRKGAKHETGD